MTIIPNTWWDLPTTHNTWNLISPSIYRQHPTFVDPSYLPTTHDIWWPSIYPQHTTFDEPSIYPQHTIFDEPSHIPTTHFKNPPTLDTWRFIIPPTYPQKSNLMSPPTPYLYNPYLNTNIVRNPLQSPLHICRRNTDQSNLDS